MKRTLTSIAAASMVLGLTVPAAFAATSHTNYNQRTISIGSYSAGLKGIAAKDPWSGANTEFMPIFYLQQGLKALGYTATWDGNTHTLAITTTSGSTTGLTKVTPGNGTVITVNGVPIVNAPKALVAKDPASGHWTSYLPIYYLADALKALGYTSSYNGAAGTWTVASAVKLAVTGAPTGNIAVGTQEMLGVTNNGTAVTSGVTWSVNGTGAVIDQMGNFVASTPGQYTVTASYEGQTATTSITVFGQAAGVKLSAASTSLSADGTSTDTITATVVDANGNAVTNYNGTVNIADSVSGLVQSNGTTNTTLSDVQIANGTGTFQVQAQGTTGIGTAQVLTTSGLSPSAGSTQATNVSYSSLSVDQVAPQATQLAVNVASTYPSAITANTANSTYVTVSVEDGSGNTWSGEPGQYVTLNISGPGTFAGGVTSQTVWVSGTSSNIEVLSEAGQAGNIVVTATASGLSSSSLQIPTYINTAPTSLSVKSANGTDSAGNPYTQYTVTLLDNNGHPITNESGNLSVTDNSVAQGGSLTYGTVNSSGVFTPGSAPTTFTDGMATFAVESNSVGTSPVTLTIKDTTDTLSTTAAYNFAPGAATQVVVSPASSVANDKIEGGQSISFTAQLEDANSNPVSEAGKTVTFSLLTNGAGATLPNGLTAVGSTYTTTTNSSGVATVSVNVPSSATSGGIEVGAVYGTNAAVDSATYTVVAASDYATQLVLANAPTTSVVAGGSVSGVTATPENAVGTAITTPSADSIQITTSNSNVLPVPNPDTAGGSTETLTSGAVSGVYTLPTFTAGQAGTATITVTDISNPSMPKQTFTVNVVPGQASNAYLELNGQQVGTASNPLNATANTPVALTVVNVDAGGNPQSVSGSSPLDVALTDANGGSFRLTPNGANVNYVQIPAGQTSATVYYVSPSTQSITTGMQALPNGVSASLAQTTSYTAGQDATGTITYGSPTATSGSGSTPASVTIGSTTYTLGTDFTSEATLVSAINGNTSTSHIAASSSGSTITLTDNQAGTAGNSVALTSNDATNLTVSGSGTLAGGTNAVPQVYTLTVNGLATYTSTTYVTVSDGTINVTVPVSITAGESATAVATAIYTALNGNTTVTGSYAVGNATAGQVTLTQSTASNATISVSVY